MNIDKKDSYIRFWSWVYRKTGYYHRAIDSIILHDILRNLESSKKRIDSTDLSISIGSWQAAKGFYR